MQSAGHHLTIGFCEREFYVDGLLPHLCLCKEVGQRQIGIRSCHQVGMMMGEQLVFHPLCHTSQHTYYQLFFPIGVFSLLSFSSLCVESFQSVQYLLFGIVAHRAGVQ